VHGFFVCMYSCTHTHTHTHTHVGDAKYLATIYKRRRSRDVTDGARCEVLTSVVLSSLHERDNSRLYYMPFNNVKTHTHTYIYDINTRIYVWARARVCVLLLFWFYIHTHTHTHYIRMHNNIITIYNTRSIVLYARRSVSVSRARASERPSTVHLYLPAMAFEEFTRTINFCRGSRSPHYIIILSSSYTHVVRLNIYI